MLLELSFFSNVQYFVAIFHVYVGKLVLFNVSAAAAFLNARCLSCLDQSTVCQSIECNLHLLNLHVKIKFNLHEKTAIQ